MTAAIALVGNPNCGKTTLFNRLTGSHHAVGNRIGVTVSAKSGVCRKTGASVIDLPGIYALTDSSAEEQITRDYLEKTPPNLIFNIVDATNLERNLLLTTQLLELGIPMVLALNMTDLLRQSGYDVDCAALARQLGIPVIPISAAKNKGLQALCSCAPPPRKKQPFTEQARRNLIENAVKHAVSKTGKNEGLAKTRRIDKILLNQYLAIPIFLLVMLAVFQLTFGPFTAMLSDRLNDLINVRLTTALTQALTALRVRPFLLSLINNGVIQSLGNILSFLPQIMILFLFLSILEDSGYMARTAFVMDGFFRKFGLSGKAILPMILGFGCTVPAAMATRTLSGARERNIALFMLPFMSCSARMPVYALFAGTFFPHHAGMVIFGLYVSGGLLALLCGLVLSKYCFQEPAQPFVLELPPYRLPTLQTVAAHVREKLMEFIKKAGTTLFLAGIVIWLLQNFDCRLRMTSDSSASLLGTLGKTIAPLFAPCGFGNWQSAVSLLSGIAAKEAVVSTMSILFDAGSTLALSQAIASVFTPASALAFLVFVLLYTPCISALGTMAHEFGSARLTALSCLLQLGVAWIMAVAVYQAGTLFL